MDYAVMGERIRRLRRAKQLTQDQLAEAAEISVSFMGHIERGTRKPSIRTIVLIADALNCSVDELLGRWADGTENSRKILDNIRRLLDENA